jgi:O-antigen ligase
MNYFKKIRPEYLTTAIVIFAVLVAPLGVAGQNIGLGLSMATYLILNTTVSWKPLRRCLVDPWSKQYVIILSLIIIPISIATILRGNLKETSRFFWGYVFVCSIPLFFRSISQYKFEKKLVLALVDFLLVFLALVATSQFLWAWKLENHQIVSTIRRAQGFYSHPLTLAYAVLPLLPWLTARCFRKTGINRELLAWMSVNLIVLTSQSVTVLATNALIIIAVATKTFNLRQWLIGSVSATLIATAVLTTSNPISEKVHMVLTGARSDHETNYPDDRMAFWHANFEMFLDAPFLGHGTGLGKEDRRPYFEKIGLGHLKRMYESHNMYLQYAVEGGVIPAFALVGFLLWWIISAKQFSHNDRLTAYVMQITAVSFAMAGLTQNSMQDSEVRYIFMLVLAGFISRI